VSRVADLYDRLGGLDAIKAVVDSFVARCAGDDRINRKFERTDVPQLKQMLVDQVCEATGGPCTYSGRDMRETHDGMGVTAGEFDALVEDLGATLDEFKVPAAEQAELVGILGPLRGDIVEVRFRRDRDPASRRLPERTGTLGWLHASDPRQRAARHRFHLGLSRPAGVRPYDRRSRDR
jgi:hemoglobin